MKKKMTKKRNSAASNANRQKSTTKKKKSGKASQKSKTYIPASIWGFSPEKEDDDHIMIHVECLSDDVPYDPVNPVNPWGNLDDKQDSDNPATRYPTSGPVDIDDYTCSKEEFHRQNYESAVKALEYYNKKNGTKYELVEALTSNAFLNGGFWIHCNFTAKQKQIDTDQEYSTELFFAELHEAVPFRLVVTACRILKGKTVAGCVWCDKLIHPTHGFRCGLYCYQPRNLRSRSSIY